MDGRIHLEGSVCCKEKGKGGSIRGEKKGGGLGAGGVTDRLKLGTFVAARHFSRQPADMTAKAGERRVAGSQGPGRNEHRVTDGSFMLRPS